MKINVNKYIGMEYSLKYFNCWDFVKMFYERELGIKLPFLMLENLNLRKQAEVIKTQTAKSYWQELEQSEPNCVCVMRQSKHPIHVGIFINNHVLHNIEHIGVVYQSLSSLKLSNWKISGYYKYVQNCDLS